MLCNNEIFINTISIIVQVIFVFSFLVVFYFLYVTKVEQEDFKEQINLIVDDLMSDINEQLLDIIVNKGIEKIKKEDIEVLMYGIIDTIEEKVSKSSADGIKQINDSNNKLRNNIYFILVGLLCIIILLFVIFSCLPKYTIVKESIITVMFIGLTELIFLTFISGKYISADPNRIKNTLGVSIKKWIKKKYPNLSCEK